VDVPQLADALRELCGRTVVSRLLDAGGTELVRWEGVLAEEEVVEPGTGVMFTVGARPLLLDAGDIRDGERDAAGAIRIAVADGTTVEITAAGS
jgi:hypothetical protein